MIDADAETGARVSLRPRAAAIAAVARELLEEQGPDELSMRNIAARLGIKAASLYEHFHDKRGIENAIIAAGLWEQGDVMAAAAPGSDDPLRAMADAYRAYAQRHPHVYRLIMACALDLDAPDVAVAEQATVEPLRAVVGDDPALALALWAFVHGVIDLELNGRVPAAVPLDAVWERGLTQLGAAIKRPAK